MRSWKGYFLTWLVGICLIGTIANALAIGAWVVNGDLYENVFQIVFYILAPIWTVIVVAFMVFE